MDLTVDRVLACARETIARVSYCWAVTPDAAGGASARLVQPGALRDDWSVRFLTSRRSRKVREIQASGRLTLGYQYDPEFSYVALVGRGEVLDDRAYKRSVWSPYATRFYPGGPDDPDVAVVHLDTERIEMWSSSRGIAPDPFGLCSAVLTRDGADWRLSTS